MSKKKSVTWLMVFLLTVVLFAGSVSAIRKTREEQQKDRIVLRFAVTSKTYVFDESNDRLKNFIDMVYAYADKSSYPTVDMFVVNGNVTGDGSENAFEAVDKITASLLREDSSFYMAMGEMDFMVGEDTGVDDPAIREKIVDSCVYVKGYPFLFVSPVYVTYEPKYQWIEEQLEKATKYSDKPVFVFQHGSLMNTFYGSETWYTVESAPIFEILEKYPQVVDFSSSTATAANTVRSVFQKNATYANTGVMTQMRMNYQEFGHDTSAEVINEQSLVVSQCKIVEVYGDGRVDILTMDLNTGEIYRKPDSEEWMRHSFYPGKTESYPYTITGKSKDAPAFDEEAVISFKEEEGKVILSFPNAKDSDGLLFYEIIVSDKNGNEVQRISTYADFALYDIPKEKSYILENLSPNTQYHVEIVPFDIFGTMGEGIFLDFSTN